jgi:hypothetical protein
MKVIGKQEKGYMKTGSEFIAYLVKTQDEDYDAFSQTVMLQGYSKDDPNDILVTLDSYRLKLSGNSLNGSARNGGKWNGRMYLRR